METTISDNRYSYTVFFDLDRTIIPKVSGRELAYVAVSNGQIKPIILVIILVNYLLYKIRLLTPQTMAEKMIGWTKNIPGVTFNELCAETTYVRLIPAIYKDALKEIEFHRDNNARIVFLSASVIQVCEKVAEKTGADDIICTELEIKDNLLTGKTSGRLCFGEEKGKRLREYCYKNNINNSESFYYGDSISDIPVFIQVGSPVCINPGYRLKKIAERNGWQTLKWSA
ncbi:MAG TPA: HAD family phosphatase [Bacteroidales bacterium]|nr:HAD family phosphatase [Bacteroidales bacterium]